MTYQGTFTLGLDVNPSIISYTQHKRFTQHRHLDPSPRRMMWRCVLKCCFSKMPAKPWHYLALSKEKASHTHFITLSSTFLSISEADRSGWSFVFCLFSDCVVPKATVDTSVMKYTLKMCDQEWGICTHVPPQRSKSICRCNYASYKVL